MTAIAPSHRQHDASSHPISYTAHTSRHHPYASPSTVPRSSPAYPAGKYRQSVPSDSHAREAVSHSYNGSDVDMRESPLNGASAPLPPSPPRSRRDPSETPSIGLSIAFGGSTGGKWWDEELPPPPAPLSSILDSFRRSGEGDRELLLSILGAKKAEEERLTALIQTRLTILQARLSLHSAAASIVSPPPQPFSQNMAPPPPPPQPSISATSNPSNTHHSPIPSPNPHPTLELRGTGPSSPSTYMHPPSNLLQPLMRSHSQGEQNTNNGQNEIHLPPPSSLTNGKRSASPPKDRRQLPPLWRDRRIPTLSPFAPTSLNHRQSENASSSIGEQTSTSPLIERRASPAGSAGSLTSEHSDGSKHRSDRSGSGLEMLYDAGISRSETGGLVRESAERGC